MRDAGFALDVRLLQGAVSKTNRCSWTILTLLSLLSGLLFALLLVPVEWGPSTFHNQSITMALRHMQPMQLGKAWKFLQPARVAQPASILQPLAATTRTATIAAPVPAIDTVVADNSLLQVGRAEDLYFRLDESVTFWKNQNKDPNSLGRATDNVREAALIMTSIAAQGSEGQKYALAHGVLRTGYFATNAVLGTLAFELNNLISGRQSKSGEKSSADEGILSRGLGFAVDLLGSFLLESALCFRQDFRAISQGLYKAPWDMSTPSHRQLTPQYAALKTLRFIDEAMGTLGRRVHEKPPGIWLDSPLYPDYYKNDFHYQTDGWMSPRSAEVYETSTETLFLGRQDAMQRLSLIPLSGMVLANKGKLRILEIACGTGRFATFIRDNHPTADMTLLDLSPFYLEAARENDEYWREVRYTSTGTRPPPATFVQAAAETLPFEAASFDAVVCVFLFHELPKAARAAAAAEMARVVSPGGIVILTDSTQRGDRDFMTDEVAQAFGKLNEPHFGTYIDTFLPSLFTVGGLICDRKLVESDTKCLSFRKPKLVA